MKEQVKYETEKPQFSQSRARFVSLEASRCHARLFKTCSAIYMYTLMVVLCRFFSFSHMGKIDRCTIHFNVNILLLLFWDLRATFFNLTFRRKMGEKAHFCIIYIYGNVNCAKWVVPGAWNCAQQERISRTVGLALWLFIVIHFNAAFHCGYMRGYSTRVTRLFVISFRCDSPPQS